MLYAANQLGLKPKLVVTNLQTANQWTLTLPPMRRIAGASQVLAAGKSLKYTIVVQSVPRVVPIPRAHFETTNYRALSAQCVLNGTTTC